MKKLVGIICMVIAMWSISVGVKAEEEDLKTTFLNEVSEIDKGSYSEWCISEITKETTLISDSDSSEYSLYIVNYDTQYLGYFIWDETENVVCEYSDGKSPYQKYLESDNENLNNCIYKYTYRNYSIENNGIEIFLMKMERYIIRYLKM